METISDSFKNALTMDHINTVSNAIARGVERDELLKECAVEMEKYTTERRVDFIADYKGSIAAATEEEFQKYLQDNTDDVPDNVKMANIAMINAYNPSKCIIPAGEVATSSIKYASDATSAVNGAKSDVFIDFMNDGGISSYAIMLAADTVFRLDLDLVMRAKGTMDFRGLIRDSIQGMCAQMDATGIIFVFDYNLEGEPRGVLITGEWNDGSRHALFAEAKMNDGKITGFNEPQEVCGNIEGQFLGLIEPKQY